jgi:putative transposase
MRPVQLDVSCILPDDNHYHLLVETPDANLSKGMRHLNGIYTQLVNRHYGRVGHLFQGRFKGILVERDSYLLELARYVVLNPVGVGMVRQPQEWPWSSYRATVGEIPAPPFLTTDWLLGASADTPTPGRGPLPATTISWSREPGSPVPGQG